MINSLTLGKNDDEIIEIFKVCNAEQLPLSLEVSRNERMDNVFIVCIEGNIYHKETLYLAITGSEAANIATLEGKKLRLSFPVEERQIEFETEVQGFLDWENNTYVEVAFPNTLQINTVREFRRILVPDHLNIQVDISRRGKILAVSKIHEISTGGLSFELPPQPDKKKVHPASALSIDLLVKILVTGPSSEGNISIPIHGVIRRKIPIHTPEGKKYNIGLEFGMISLTSRGQFNALLQYVQREADANRERPSHKSKERIQAECEAKKSSRELRHPDVKTAISAMDTGRIIQLLDKWGDDKTNGAVLVKGLLSFGTIDDLLTAAKALIKAENPSNLERLITGVQAKKDLSISMRFLEVLPIDSPQIDGLLGAIARDHPADAVLAALNDTSQTALLNQRMLHAFLSRSHNRLEASGELTGGEVMWDALPPVESGAKAAKREMRSMDSVNFSNLGDSDLRQLLNEGGMAAICHLYSRNPQGASGGEFLKKSMVFIVKDPAASEPGVAPSAQVGKEDMAKMLSGELPNGCVDRVFPVQEHEEGEQVIYFNPEDQFKITYKGGFIVLLENPEKTQKVEMVPLTDELPKGYRMRIEEQNKDPADYLYGHEYLIPTAARKVWMMAMQAGQQQRDKENEFGAFQGSSGYS